MIDFSVNFNLEEIYSNFEISESENCTNTNDNLSPK